LNGSNRDGRGRELKVVFKNVRKIRSVVKQRECLAYMEKERVDICGINESGLNDDEFVDGGEGYEWFGCNRPAIEGKGGGVGFLVKKGLQVSELKEYTGKDCLALCVKGMSGSGVNVILVNVYQKCEGVNVVENKERMAMIQKVTERARMKGEMLIVGGDFNGHIWELDGVENVNGRMLKECAIENDLEIMNVIWNGMQECTWESGGRSYHLDYIMVNDSCREKVKDSWVGGLDDVVESDHRVVGLRMEWVGETRKRGGAKKKRIVPEDKWEEFGRKVDEEIRQGKGVQESMCLVATELAEVRRGSRRREWWDEEAAEAVGRRKQSSKTHRRMRKMWGADSDQAKQAWREYQEAKEEASAVMLKKMNETNRKRMQDLGRGAERNRNMFRELKNWMNKGKGKEELVEFLTEEGEAIKNEDEIVVEIEKVWGKLLNTSGEAVLGVEKERFEMIDGDREITRGELEKAWSKIKRGKAMDESGVCGEYLRALTEESKGRVLRGFNEILSGAVIPEDWRASRLTLLRKGGGQEGFEELQTSCHKRCSV
jgi:exonuclease III